jgi:protein-tyrosine phosphatase
MADAVFQELVRKNKLENQIVVDSAGTGSWHLGEPAHRGTLKILQEKNIPYDGRSRKISSSDFQTFDYILGMDHSNLSNMKQFMSSAKRKPAVNLFLQFAYDEGIVDVLEVPDPYYHDNFDYVYELVLVGCQALLSHIRAEHSI